MPGPPFPLSHHQQLCMVSLRETCYRAQPGGAGCQRRVSRSRQDSLGSQACFHPQPQPLLSEAGTCRSNRAQASAFNCKHVPVNWKSSEVATPQPGKQERLMAFLCILNKTASTDACGCCHEAARPGSREKRL